MLPSSLKMIYNMTSQGTYEGGPTRNQRFKKKSMCKCDWQSVPKASLQQELMGVYKNTIINMLGGLSGCLLLFPLMLAIWSVYADLTSTAIQTLT